MHPWIRRKGKWGVPCRIAYFNLIFAILAILVVAAGSFRSLTFLPVVIANLFIGILQEIRAKKTLDQLTMLNAPKAEVVRNGHISEIPAEELVLDDMFDQNVQGALDAGLDVGVYFFSQAISAAEAVEEAEFVLENVKKYDITGPVVYDTEEIKWDSARTDQNTKQEFTNYCKVFCDTVSHAGYDPMIYSNMEWMAFTLDMEELSEYDFWYADYSDIPQCPYDYKIWQYSESGVVPGINANVDLNLWFREEKKQ